MGKWPRRRIRLAPGFKRRHITPVQIAIDEYEQGDITVVTAVIFPERHIERLTTRWTALRRRIKKYLMASYPSAMNDPDLLAGQLPEIHAVEMYQSQGIYRGDASLVPQYWLHHRRWLERAVRLIRSSRPRVLSFRMTKQHMTELIRMIGVPSETFAAGLKYKRMLDKMDRLARSPYVWTLNNMIDALDMVMKEDHLTGSIVCDEHDDGHGFSLLRTFEMAKIQGLQAIEAPRFRSSKVETLLQAADVVSYIAGTVYFVGGEVMARRLHPSDLVKSAEVRGWADVLNRAFRRAPPAYKKQWRAATARQLELLIAHSGGPKPYQHLVQSKLPAFIDAILRQGDRLSFHLADDGIRMFLDDKMYKGSSEDEPLSPARVKTLQGDVKNVRTFSNGVSANADGEQL